MDISLHYSRAFGDVISDEKCRDGDRINVFLTTFIHPHWTAAHLKSLFFHHDGIMFHINVIQLKLQFSVLAHKGTSRLAFFCLFLKKYSPFPFLLPNLPSLLSFKFMTSFYINCYYMYIHTYIYIIHTYSK